MLNTVVAIVLGNALVAALFALGVVLLARWYHKPALLHGLWVVVLLKLVTPPMLTIPVPVEMPALAPVENESTMATADPLAESAASVKLKPAPAELLIDVEPGPTILIEDPLDGESEPSEFKIGEADEQGNFSLEVADGGEQPTESTAETSYQIAPVAANPVSSESIGFPATVPGADHSAAKPKPAFVFSWRSLFWPLLLIWAAGVLFVFVAAMRQILRFERSLRQAIPADETLRTRVELLARRLGLALPPEVFLLKGTVSPMLWGFGRKPRLLLPRDLLEGLDQEAIETLILHELAHMRRGDHWVRVLELFCQCIYWWHPVVWWGRKQLRIVEEECCDAFVVEHCQGGVYARALLATVDFLSQKKHILPPAASGIGQLEFLKRRLTMIMEGGVSARLAGLPKFFLLTAAVVALSILPRLVAQTTETTKEKAPAAKADEETSPEKAPAAETKPAAPKSTLLPIGPEPVEFEKTPQGYPTAQLEVRDLAFSPDGKLLAAGYGKWSTSGEVVVYEYATKRVLKKFPQEKGVASVVFSKDGKYLAASAWNNVLQIWDTSSWELVADKATGSRVARLAFSPDGKYLAWGNEAAELKLVTVGKWNEERAITGDLFRFQKVAFSPDGKLLCAVGGKFEQPRFGRGLVIEVETGKQIAKIETEGAVMASAAFSPDGKELATGEFATSLRFWEPTTGKPISTIQIGGTMDSLEYTPDGILVGPSYSGRVHMIKDRQIFRTMSGHEGQAQTARMSPDGKSLVSGGMDALIRVWNPETGVPLGTIRPNEALEDTQEAVLAIAHSPDGRYVVTTHEDTSIRLRDAETGTFLKLMKGHEDVVATAAFSPDGKTLATGSYDHMVKLWNVETGEVIRELKGHSNWVFSVAFSPDGKTLASGGYDKSVRIWNVETGESLAVLEGHSAAVRSLAYSPDGNQLVTGSSDRTLRLWDLKTQKTIQEMKGHTAAVRAVAFSPTGAKIASASEDKTLRFWDPKTGLSTQELKGHTGMVWALAFSPRGRTLASGGFDNSLRIWNGETGAAIQTLTGHQDVITSLSYAPDSSSLVTGSYDKSLKFWQAIEPPIPALADLNIGEGSDSPNVRFVDFTPDGKRMVTGSQNRQIRLWDLDKGRVIKTVTQARGMNAGVLSDDGKLIATAGYDEEAYLFDAETLELIATIDNTGKGNFSVAISPDNKLIVLGGWEGSITIWDAATREKIRELPQQTLPVEGLAFSPDGRWMASATGNYKEHQNPGSVRLWDTKTWEEVANLPGPKQKMRGVHFSPDGKTLVANGSQHDLLFYDLGQKKLTKSMPFGTEVSSVAFLQDSRTAVLSGWDGRVELWDLQTGTRLARYAGHQPANQDQRYIFDVAASPDGSVVASAGGDGHVMLWPTSSMPPVKALGSMTLENAEALAVVISPDGKRLAVATTNKTIEIRDTKTWNILHTIKGLNTSCVSLAFSPVGKSFAGAMQGGKAFVWDVETGEELVGVEGHPGGSRRAVFSPDGKLLATCGWDETAAVWNLPNGSLRYRTEKQGLALSDVKFSPEGKLLLTATGSYHEWRKPGTIKIWKADDGAPVATLGSHEAEIKGLLLDAGGHFLLSYGGNGAKVWSLITRKVARSIGTGTTITSAALSPDGNLLFTGDRSGLMMIYDVTTGKVKQTLAGHEALVYFVSSTPDGTLIASSSKDGSVKLWPGSRIPAFPPLAQIQDDPEQLFDVAYSPDGRILAAAGKDKTITLRDAKTLEVLKELSGHNGIVFRLAFAPDGTSLLSGSTDGTVRQWNIADGKELFKWKAHGEMLEMVRSLAVSADGKQVAAGNWAGETFVWNVETKKELYRLPKQALPVIGLAFSPDGKHLATCTGTWKDAKANGQLKLWNAQTGEEQATLEGHSGEIRGILFTPDSQTLISAGRDQSIRHWNVATKQLMRTDAHPFSIGSIALGKDGRLAIGYFGGGFCLTDSKTGNVVMRTHGHSQLLCGLAYSPDGARIASVCHAGILRVWPTSVSELAIRQLPAPKAGEEARLAEQIRHWQSLVLDDNPTSMTRVKSLKPHGEKVWFAVYSPDGKVLATGGDDQTVKLWNASTLEPMATLTGHKAFTSHAAFSPDGTRIATVSWAADRTVKLWDVATGKLLASAAPHGAGCRRVAFSPDGNSIATACEDGHLRLFNSDLALMQDINLGLNVYSVAFSPDGNTLAVGTGNWKENKPGRLALYDPQTGRKLKEFAGSDGHIFHLQFLKNGKELLANNAGAGCSIWNVETGTRVETYRPEQDTRWVEISRDEKRIVASVRLGTVQIWNRNESQPIVTFKASDKFVHCAAFSPDGKRVLVGAEDGTLSVWEMETQTTAVAEKQEKAQ